MMKHSFLIALLVIFFELSFCPFTIAAEQNSELNGHQCSAVQIPTYENSKYDREQGSYDYLPYAIASFSAYGTNDYQEFELSNYDTSWKKQESITYDTGMYADYYFKDAETLDVMIAFRGTRGSAFKDWYSNLSWLTWIFPGDNHYDSARKAFQIIVDKAIKAAGNKTIRFVATGHSLGGGLAQHVALAYPCVSAAVFDASCVTDEFTLDKVYTPDIVLLHEDGDELTSVCRLIGYNNEAVKFHTYPVNYIPSDQFQHRITGFVVGMARGVADCQREQRIGIRSCSSIPSTDTRAKEIYCRTYGTYGPDNVICPELLQQKKDGKMQ